MATDLFISDLHLDTAQENSLALFEAFVRGPARSARRLYILGDLFESWVGDDAPSHLADHVAGLLSNLAGQGVTLAFMAGNRDFLVGERYLARCGMRGLADPTRIELAGQPVLLSHGDTLCTDDAEYQAFRRQVRDPEWQAGFLALGVDERLAFARQARDASRQHTATKPADIMDVNDEAVARLMRAHQVSTLLHGHTHRPHDHRIELAGQPARRVVLGDWHDSAVYARADHQGLRLESITL